MSKALSIPTERLAASTKKAWDRLDDLIVSGGSREAIEAIKLVLARTMPEPKTSSAAAIAAAAMGASAGATDRTIALTKAREREQAARLDAPSNTLDATFTPLPRVQRDE